MAAPCKTPAVTVEGGGGGGGKLGELEMRLAALKARMEAGLPARAAELRSWITRLEEPEAPSSIERIAHKLRGIAGTHGHATLGAQAELVERLANEGSSELRREAEELARRIDAAATGGSAPRAARVATAPVVKRLTGLRIAALDDDDATRRLLALTLTSVGGADGHVVSSVTELEVLADGGLDLVIVDAMMPDTNGLEVMGRLRARGAALRFAVLSAATAEELGWTGSDVEAAAWLRKPFRPLELVDAIATILGRSAPAPLGAP